GPDLAPVEVPSPGVAALGDGTFGVRSRRGAPTLGVRWTGDARVWVDGVEGSPTRRGARSELWVHGVPEGAQIRLDPVPPAVQWLDESYEPPLPGIVPSDPPLPRTAPFQDGDRLRSITEG
ncbi:MAG: hypothetical protein ABMA64_10955, partial [Myxococcota bacterium]